MCVCYLMGMSSGKEQPLLSFGVIADVQYADIEPKEERHFRASLEKLKAAVADLSGEGLAFTLQVGDLIDQGMGSLEQALPVFGALGHPVHHVLGNHDFSVEEDEKVEIPERFGLERGYRRFQQNEVQVLLLDTNEISSYRYPKASPVGKAAAELMVQMARSGDNQARPWNGGTSKTQLDWLRRQLQAAEATGEPVVICGHHPLLPEEGHQAWNSREILAVIEEFTCVRAYLCGHHHNGAQVMHGGVPYITFRSMLHEPGVTAYAVVRLFADRLVIEGRGREESREIAFS